jgi:hypothetical protein
VPLQAFLVTAMLAIAKTFLELLSGFAELDRLENVG